MWRPMTALGLCLSLILASVGTAAEAPPTDPEVIKGIKLVDDGDFDAAIVTLDSAARRLASNPGKVKELSQAYLYLGIAYVGKGHEAAAKAKFREALTQIKDITLSPDKFPPKVIDVFEAARSESQTAKATTPAPTPAKEKKKGSSKGILIGVGVAAAAGAGIALAAGGGGGGSPAVTQPADPRIVNPFGPITLSENDYEQNFKILVGGTGSLEATVTWTNQSGTGVLAMNLFDAADNAVAVSNRTNDTTSLLTANVQPSSGSPTQEYRIQVFHRDSCNGCVVVFNLTVRHP